MDAKSTVGVLFGEQHFGAARLGDQRLTDRLVHTANLLVAHPGGTFPTKLNTPADLDGFYRLMASPKVTHAAVLAPHQQRTWQQMREHEGVVLIVHDTTVLDYSGLHEIKELGQIGLAATKTENTITLPAGSSSGADGPNCKPYTEVRSPWAP